MAGGRVERIGNIVADLFARRGYGRLQSLSAALEAWQEAAGPVLAAHTRPGNIRRGVLEVLADSSVIAQEIAYQKPEILARLAERLPDQPIGDLRVRVGRLDQAPPKPAAAPGNPPRRQPEGNQ